MEWKNPRCSGVLGGQPLGRGLLLPVLRCQCSWHRVGGVGNLRPPSLGRQVWVNGPSQWIAILVGWGPERLVLLVAKTAIVLRDVLHGEVIKEFRRLGWMEVISHGGVRKLQCTG
jgi:hypothetical protein